VRNKNKQGKNMFHNKRSTLVNTALSFFLLMSVSANSWSDGHGNHDAANHSDAIKTMREFIGNFVKVFNEGDAATIAALYTENAIWSVAGLSEPVYGRAAIQAGIEGNSDGSVAGATLEAEVFTAQDLGNGFLMANGSWTQRDASGSRVDGGLWGDVFQVVDGEVLLHLESTSRN
jgi:ketosteroid isomerase-like protein